MGAMTTEGISISNKGAGGGGGGEGAMTTEGISILINELRGGCSENRRYFNTN